MSLSQKITWAFAVVTVVMIATLLAGVPYVLSEVSMRQMDSHVQTFGAFLGSNLESLAEHEPGLFQDAARREDRREMVGLEFRKAIIIAQRSGSFAVLSIDLLGPDRKDQVVGGDPSRVVDGQNLATLEADLSQNKAILRQDSVNGSLVPLVEEFIVPLVFKNSGRWVLRIHFDFAKSMELHRDQYLTFQIGSRAQVAQKFRPLLLIYLRYLQQENHYIVLSDY